MKSQIRELNRSIFSRYGLVCLGFAVGLGMPASRAEDRTLDGRGNNRQIINRGAANTPLIRFGYPPQYPGNGSGSTMLTDAQRVNPRTVSNTVSAQSVGIPSARNLSDHIWIWGQFLDHDLDLSSGSNGAAVNGAAPISVAPNDVLGPAAIPFTRSNFVIPGGGPGAGVRQQINEVTSYIDGSQIYGSSLSRSSALRTQGGTGAKLELSAGNLLPYNTNGLANDNSGPVPGDQLFLAGDVRANENVGLTAMHTVFAREHNRLVDVIAQQQPSLSAEQQFQLARKIVGAELQVITYNEFLPALLGTARAPTANAYQYNPQLPSDITQSFAHSAFRYGHSTVSPQLRQIDNYGDDQEDISLRSAFFNPTILTEAPSAVDLLLKGAATQVSQEIDTRVIDDLRNFLFGPPGAGGLDLASLNLQRGRDHGLPDYNRLRPAYGLPPVGSFNQITSDPNLAQALSSLYGGNINNVDSWIAGLAENHLPGSSVGGLFNGILVSQFQRLRDGDRLFYLSNDLGLYQNRVLRPEIASIIDLNSVRLSDVISWNTEITNLQDNVFFASRFVRSGDFNQDGDFACDDLDRLTANIVAGIYAPTWDLNGDQVVDGDDLRTWLTEAGIRELASAQPYQVGDANLDGFVDGSDFNLWNSHKFTSGFSFCEGDFNADGFVDGSDFNLWNSEKFTSTVSAVLVPEPVSMALMVGIALVACRRTSRFRVVRFGHRG